MNSISIKRIERSIISGEEMPISSELFPNEQDASKFLQSRVPALTDEQLCEIFSHEQTHFENREMINRGNEAYLGTVIYEIAAGDGK